MDHFIQVENFSKIAPYAQLFWQGLLVTVLLSLFVVVAFIEFFSEYLRKKLS